MYKKLISISLLTFVSVSIGFLVYKEFTQRNLKKVESTTKIQTPNLSLNQKNFLIKNDIISKKPITKSRKTEPSRIHSKEEKKSFSETQPQLIKSTVIAYYFHATRRCLTCLRIERYSKGAIEQYFTEELREGRLEFKTLNVEIPENRHYIKDYQLYTKSLVITLYKDNKQIKWKNLTEVWTYVRDKEKFYQYVRDEIEKILQETE